MHYSKGPPRTTTPPTRTQGSPRSAASRRVAGGGAVAASRPEGKKTTCYADSSPFMDSDTTHVTIIIFWGCSGIDFCPNDLYYAIYSKHKIVPQIPSWNNSSISSILGINKSEWRRVHTWASSKPLVVITCATKGTPNQS
ncbi:hypothetical protein MTP99_014654 [Tenebrio molitor]|nr:hypothetical protein MTP99_014654 [Tenebrio molitor]